MGHPISYQIKEGNMLLLKFILAMLPIIWLIIALSGLKMAGHKACVSALVITAVLAIGYWKLSIVNTATAALEGALNALWPICLVIIAALFTYNLTLKTGAMEQIKRMLAGVSSDKRVLALIIGWGFGNFMEGMAGFGTAVAIPASMLVAIGLDPLSAVVGCLVVNSTPTAFGSVGVPTVTLSSVTSIPVLQLSADVSLIQALLVFISPFFLVAICGKGIKAIKGMIPMTLIASLSYLLPWYAAAHLIGPELPDIMGSIISMVCMVVAARFLNRNPDPEYSILSASQHAGSDRALSQSAAGKSKTAGAVQAEEGAMAQEGQNAGLPPITVSDDLKAWSPFILIFVLLILTSALCPPIHNAIAGIRTEVSVYTGDNPGTLGFSWVNTPGVIIFIAAIIGGIIQKATAHEMLTILAETLKKYWKTILTICSVMAIAKIMGYSGMISDIAALLVAATGSFYPAIAPLIGVLGAFVTGSGTSTCVLFGGLQSQTAATLGLSSSWMAAANVMGAGIGKMVCPQGIAIGAGAINMVGSESKILKAVFKFCLIYTVIAGAVCFIGAQIL